MSKRLFDIIVTLNAAPFAGAVVLVAAAILAIELRGNPFFLQKRIGLRGRPFTMFKLRTMRYSTPGEEPRHEIKDWDTFYFHPPGEPLPRVSRFGAFCRATSIDELPNLLNVLLGQMSLVGPRPEVPEIVAQYPPDWHRRHDVLPGIAGLAQVSGRSDLPYSRIIEYDLDYVQNHGLLRDIAILARTLAMVVTGRGAR